MIKLLTTDGIAFVNPEYIEVIQQSTDYDRQNINSEIKCTITTSSGKYISVLDLSVHDIMDIYTGVKYQFIKELKSARNNN